MKKTEPTLSFLAKCLTLELYPDRADEIGRRLRSDGFDPEIWVKGASDQFVLPAVFIHLKRAGLQDFIPVDMREHIEQLTQLNRERNRQILDEVSELAGRLAKRGIEPVFLKGTAHLLLDLYRDPAERMIGDIDFLVNEEDLLQAVEVLREMQFNPLVKFNAAIHGDGKHYPRMVNYDYAAAIEVHRQVVLVPYSKYFRATDILSEKQEISGMPGVFVPSYRHLLIHNMMNAQFNDKAYRDRVVLLRQMYDFMLLSGRTNPQEALRSLGHYHKQSNAWLALNAELFEMPNELKYENSGSLQRYVKGFVWLQNHPRSLVLFRTITYFSNRLIRYISLPVQAVFNRQARKGLWARLSDPKWYGKHLNSYRDYFSRHRKFEKRNT